MHTTQGQACYRLTNRHACRDAIKKDTADLQIPFKGKIEIIFNAIILARTI